MGWIENPDEYAEAQARGYIDNDDRLTQAGKEALDRYEDLSEPKSGGQ